MILKLLGDKFVQLWMFVNNTYKLQINYIRTYIIAMIIGTPIENMLYFVNLDSIVVLGWWTQSYIDLAITTVQFYDESVATSLMNAYISHQFPPRNSLLLMLNIFSENVIIIITHQTRSEVHSSVMTLKA